MAEREPGIIIVGCGPGAPGYLAPLARQAIEGAEVLAGAKRLLDLFPQHPGERIIAGADVESVLEEIEARRHGRRVAVLVTGDPGLCSLAQPVLRRFGRRACEVIPGISSVQVAFARMGLDWLDARIIDAHGADPEIRPASLAGCPKIAVLTGGKASLPWIARLARSLGESYRLFVCQDLTLPEESIRRLKPAELEGLEISPRTIILLVEEKILP